MMEFIRKKQRMQKNYGKEKLARAQGELARLRDTIQALSKEHSSLQAKHDAFAACMELANQELYSAAASRLALGRRATELLRQQQQMQYTLAALPPPEEWDDGIKQRIDSLSREELRYVMLTHYREAVLMLGAVQSDPTLLGQLDTYARKHKSLAYRCFYNPSAWITMVQANLETGEMAAAPQGWYAYVARSIPGSWLPQGFLPFLREGMNLYHERADALLVKRHVLCRQVQAILQAMPAQATEFVLGYHYSRRQLLRRILDSASATSGPEGSGSGTGSDRSRAGSGTRVGSVPGGPHASSPQPEVITLDPPDEPEQPEDMTTALDEALRQIEETLGAELRTNSLLLEYVLQKLPHYVLACCGAVSYPYNVHMPSVFEELLRAHDSGSKSCAIHPVSEGLAHADAPGGTFEGNFGSGIRCTSAWS